jgi:GNAT superfamily N-acetyltransferase
MIAEAHAVLFADHALAWNLERAEAWSNSEYASAWRRLHPENGAVAQTIGDGLAVYTGVDSPVTQVVGLGMSGPVTSQHLDEIEGFFISRGAPVRILVCPLAHPTLLPELTARGYRALEFENVMARALSTPGPEQPADADPTWPAALLRAEAAFSGISVRPVNPDEEEAYSRMVAYGFSAPREPRPVEMVLSGVPFAMDKTICLVARLQGEPAGGGALSLYEGVAIIFGDSTLPGYRGRGVQSALLRERLALATEHGCRWALAGAVPGGRSQHNQEYLGFQVMYTRVTMVKET